MPRITRASKDAFLDRIAAGYSINKATEAAGHHRTSWYGLRDRDETFAAAWAAAAAQGEVVRNDVIRDEIRRRAIDGVDEPVYYQGNVVGHVRRYSDTVLLAMANAHLPDYRAAYAGRRGVEPEPANQIGATSDLDLTRLSDTELDRLRELVAKARPPLAAVG